MGALREGVDSEAHCAMPSGEFLKCTKEPPTFLASQFLKSTKELSSILVCGFYQPVSKTRKMTVLAAAKSFPPAVRNDRGGLGGDLHSSPLLRLRKALQRAF